MRVADKCSRVCTRHDQVDLHASAMQAGVQQRGTAVMAARQGSTHAIKRHHGRDGGSGMGSEGHHVHRTCVIRVPIRVRMVPIQVTFVLYEYLCNSYEVRRRPARSWPSAGLQCFDSYLLIYK